MKKSFSFVQVNFQQGPKNFNSFYLPYSAGVISAYALSDLSVSENWQLDHLVWRREPIETVADRLKDQQVVAFSVYTWNKNWSYSLGKLLKQLNPNIKIVVGGPEPAVTDPDIFNKHPWMDAVVVMEGEYVFHKLLKYNFENIRDIPGLLVNYNNTVINTGPSQRISNLEELPSPYLIGTFDQIIKDNPECNWIATLETTRGCPYQCTFCDWGSLTFNKVKKYELDRIFAELEWMGKNSVYISFTDANFGMFVDRDKQIIDKLIQIQTKYRKVTNFTITWAKNQNKTVVELAKKLQDESPFAGQALTMSLQSNDAKVLETIKRKNLASNKVSEIYELCNKNNVPVETELILGLPNDTVYKWKENFYSLFDMGNHMGITINQAQLLENAEMNLSQRKEFKMQTADVFDYYSDAYENDDLKEKLEIVIATDLIGYEDMLDLWTWNSFIKSVHISGLGTYIARFLNKHYNIDYRDYYNGLWTYIQQDPWFASELNNTRKYFDEWVQNGEIDYPLIGKNRVLFGWNLVSRLTIELHIQNKIDHLYNLIENYIRKEFNVEHLSELIEFQKQTVLQYDTLKSFPKTYPSRFDFYGYIVHSEPLNQSVVYSITTKEDVNMEKSLFFSFFHYARKRYFGNAIVNYMH